MKTLTQEIEELYSTHMAQSFTYESTARKKEQLLAKHIDEIEKILRYLVDQKVEEKYPSGSKRFTKGISDGK